MHEYMNAPTEGISIQCEMHAQFHKQIGKHHAPAENYIRVSQI